MRSKNAHSPTSCGRAQTAVAHTAAVPPADIKVNGKVLFSNVANGESLHVVVPAGTYKVQIVPTGQNGPSILGPADLPVKGGSLTNVYAIGEPKSGTMNVVVHEIRLSETGTEYTVWGSTNLTDWTEVTVSTVVGTGGEVEFDHTPPANTPIYFYQVRDN